MEKYTEEDGGAGQALDQSPPNPNQQPRQDTFFLPPGFPGADSLQAGDTLTLKVVGRSAEGELEVEPAQANEDGESDWKQDLHQTMASGSDNVIGGMPGD